MDTGDQTKNVNCLVVLMSVAAGTCIGRYEISSRYRQLNSTRNKISDVGDRNARFVIWLINDRLDANGLIP